MPDSLMMDLFSFEHPIRRITLPANSEQPQINNYQAANQNIDSFVSRTIQNTITNLETGVETVFILGQNLSERTKYLAVAALIPLRESRIQFVRNFARELLETIIKNSENKVGLLVSLIRNRNEGVYGFVFSEMFKIAINSPEIVTALIDFMGDENSLVRELARSGLMRIVLNNIESFELVETFTSSLSNRNANIRIGSTRCLSILGIEQNFPENTLGAIISLLNDRNSEVRSSAASALRQQDLPERAIARLISLLNDRDSEVRNSAISTLGDTGQGLPGVITALIPLLSDTDSNVRVSAAMTLGNLGQDSSEVLTALFPLINNDDSDFSEVIRAAIGQIGRNSSQAFRNQISVALTPSLRSNNIGLKISAGDVLARVGLNLQEVISALTPILGNSNPDIRMRVIQTLDKTGQNLPQVTRDQTVRALISLLGNQAAVRALDRSFMITELGRIGRRASQTVKNEIVNVLMPILRDEDSDDRERVVIALGSIEQFPHEEISLLMPFLINSDSTIRINTARALGATRQRSSEVTTELVSLLVDRDQNVVAAVMEALGHVGEGSKEQMSDLVRRLISALNSPEESIKTAAASALGNLGQVAVPQLIQQFGNMSGLTISRILTKVGEGAINDLIEALNHENAVIRGNAAITLGRIIHSGTRVNEQKLNQIIAGISRIVSNNNNRNRTVRDARMAAIQALGLIGIQAQSAIPLLTNISTNPNVDGDLRIVAENALNMIGGR